MADLVEKLNGAARRSEALIRMYDLKGAAKTTMQRTVDCCLEAQAEIERLRALIMQYENGDPMDLMGEAVQKTSAHNSEPKTDPNTN